MPFPPPFPLLPLWGSPWLHASVWLSTLWSHVCLFIHSGIQTSSGQPVHASSPSLLFLLPSATTKLAAASLLGLLKRKRTEIEQRRRKDGKTETQQKIILPGVELRSPTRRVRRTFTLGEAEGRLILKGCMWGEYRILPLPVVHLPQTVLPSTFPWADYSFSISSSRRQLLGGLVARKRKIHVKTFSANSIWLLKNGPFPLCFPCCCGRSWFIHKNWLHHFLVWHLTMYCRTWQWKIEIMLVMTFHPNVTIKQKVTFSCLSTCSILDDIYSQACGLSLTLGIIFLYENGSSSHEFIKQAV